MKKVVFFVVFLIFFYNLLGQPGWTWQNPLPQGNPLHSISFVSSCGWAVGPMGTAIWTCDYGETWQKVDLGTTKNLNSVYMHDDLMAFMVGDDGLILFVMEDQTNGTFEIVQHNSPTNENLTCITSNLNGCPWAVGENGAIIRASDLWDSWELQNEPYGYDLYSLDNIECTEAFAVGPEGLLLYTSDLGNTWEQRWVPTTWDLYSVDIGQFDNIRVAGQSGTIWFTDDKGLTWEEQHQELGYQLYDIQNIGTNVAYAVGSDVTILETIDYGDNWSHAEVDQQLVNSPLYDVEDHYGFDHVWAVGYRGLILRNSGIETEFEVQNEGWMDNLHAIDFVNENEGWAVGGEYDYSAGISRGIILHTEDGGETWEEQISINTLLTDVDFVDENNGWAVGRNGMIKHTTNGGDTWYTAECPLEGMLTSICFADENNGWVVSRDFWGEIIHTNNAGGSWNEQENPQDQPLHDVFFINDQIGWAVGLDTTILRTWDGGQVWHGVENYPVGGCRYTSVFFIDEMKGWAVGTNGRIVRSADGGQSWEEIESGVSSSIILESVFFLDANNGWIAGDRGTILRTVDGGLHWFELHSRISTNFLTSVVFTDPLKGWICGEGGTIVHTENGGFLHEPGTFLEIGLDLPILDNEETSSTIEVDVSEVITTEYTLTGLEIFIDTILHSRVSDLEITLAHEGITQTIVNHVNDDGENFLWTQLKEGASTSITDGLAPFSGQYSAYNSLDVFNGTDPNGKWTLKIFDSETGHTGFLNAWGINPIFIKTTAVSELPDQKSQLVQFSPNIPNPFDQSTRISWHSKINGQTILIVYNNAGKEICRPVNEYRQAGKHHLYIDGRELPCGIYFCWLMVGSENSVMKMVVSR